jgi:hypothetical protein
MFTSGAAPADVLPGMALIETFRRRPPRLRRVVAPPPAPRPSGRAWINGREVDGPARAVAHLSRAHD